jgi:branched-chain amino acid aminotransferase
MHVWLNGRLLDRDDAAISVFDAGLQHGIGLFETMLARHGAIFRGRSHMDRLAGSARELLLTERLGTEALLEAVHQTLKANRLEQARVRLTVTGGNLAALPTASPGAAERLPREGVDATILIVAQPPTEYPAAFFEQGVRVTIADGRTNPLDRMAGHKTLNYWSRIQALQQAAARQAGEAVWFTVSNHLAGGSVSNIFLVKGGELLTPIARGEEQRGALPAPVLPGITRAAVIELARGISAAARSRMLDINDLLGADEVFLTNSSWGVLPVVGVERESIAGGEVGPITQSLRGAWLKLVDHETLAGG